MSEAGPIPGAPDDPILLALGFTLAHEEVDTAIVGTTDPQHMHENLERARGALPIAREAVQTLHHRYDESEAGWLQLT